MFVDEFAAYIPPEKPSALEILMSKQISREFSREMEYFRNNWKEILDQKEKEDNGHI